MNPSQVLSILVSGAVASVVVAIINYVSTRPKNRAEAAKIAGETANALILELRTTIRGTQERLDEVIEDNDRLHGENKKLQEDNLLLRKDNHELHQHMWALQSWIKRNYRPREGDEPIPELKRKGQ